MYNSHRVGSPENEGEKTQGAEQLDDLSALGLDHFGSMESNVPDDKNVGDACNGVPAPLLGIALTAICRKQPGEDHDNISNNGHQCVSTIDASQQAQVEQEERRGYGPLGERETVSKRFPGTLMKLVR